MKKKLLRRSFSCGSSLPPGKEPFGVECNGIGGNIGAENIIGFLAGTVTHHLVLISFPTPNSIHLNLNFGRIHQLIVSHYRSGLGSMTASTHHCKLLLFWSVLAVLEAALAFSSSARRLSARGRRRRQPPSSSLLSSPTYSEALVVHFASPTNDEGDDEDDWRTFRAKLVMSEGGTTSSSSSTENENTYNMDDSDLDGFGALFSDNSSAPATLSSPPSLPGFTPLEPSQWAYYSGKVIEQGAVILGGVEQDFGFGLRQQYFHKAVILVLDHDESTFTKGVILNRPSNRVLEDDVNVGLQWKVWFGGDVQGLDSLLPDIVCLHSLRSKEAMDVSVSVMKDIQVSVRSLFMIFICIQLEDVSINQEPCRSCYTSCILLKIPTITNILNLRIATINTTVDNI